MWYSTSGASSTLVCNAARRLATPEQQLASSRTQRSGRKAGMQTGMYDVPASGKRGWNRVPLSTNAVSPALSSTVEPSGKPNTRRPLQQ